MAETAIAETKPQRARRMPMTAPAQAEPEPVPTAAPVAPPTRPVRVPFGTRQQRLDNTPIPGFQCYWVNDIPGRIDKAKRAGYEHVQNEDGTPKKEVVGVAPTGGPLFAYRMKLPIEFYNEDMAAKEAPRAAIDQDMRKFLKEGGYSAEGRPAYASVKDASENHPLPAAANLDPVSGRQRFNPPPKQSQP